MKAPPPLEPHHRSERSGHKGYTCWDPSGEGGRNRLWEGDPLPRVEGVFDAIFVNQVLELALSLLFAPGTDHRMVEKDELELKPPRFSDLRRLGEISMPCLAGVKQAGRSSDFPFCSTTQRRQAPKGISLRSWQRWGIRIPAPSAAPRIVPPFSTATSVPSILSWI